MKVHYYGPVGYKTGFGRAATDLCMALLRDPRVELEVAPIASNTGEQRGLRSHQEALVARLRSDHEMSPAPDVVIVHTLPVDAPAVAGRIRSEWGWSRDDGPAFIAYTTWEAIDTPLWLLSNLDTFDQVWVPSTVNARAFQCPVGGMPLVSPIHDKVRVVPHGYDPELVGAIPAPERAPDDLFRFYYAGAWNSRKNPLGLIRAFAHAFNPDDKVRLFMHMRGASHATISAALASCGVAESELPNIGVNTDTIADEQVQTMHRKNDCFVTASRGEAWNLPAFDAMLAGRHVITTANLGSNEYLEHTTATNVGAVYSPAMVDVTIRGEREAPTLSTSGAQGLTSKCRWLEPSLNSLAYVMREAYENRTRDIAVRYDLPATFGFDAVAKIATNLIESAIQ